MFDEVKKVFKSPNKNVRAFFCIKEKGGMYSEEKREISCSDRSDPVGTAFPGAFGGGGKDGL